MSVLLSSNLDDSASVPYFLWDEPMTVAEFRRALNSKSVDEKNRLLAKMLREARDTDVWKFTTPQEILEKWDEISRYLGRRRVFWKFLLDSWQRENLIGGK